MPMATQFNEVVAMDIKYIKEQPVLHLIDCLTRFSASTIVPNKKAETIISSIFRIWISIFGPPATFLSDNGGEFANEKFLSMGEAYNIKVKTTAAESPWSNGLCERYNGILGEMTEKIIEDTGCSLTVALAWANSAKNTLQTVHGFSPSQLVFGYNPMLPSVLSDKPPALSSESAYATIVEENLKAQRIARIAHVQAESSERIRRALNKNIRSSGDIKYINGDSVYFRRNQDNKWKGPATVIGQDGQLVLIRLQSTWFRVHPCNLQLINQSEMSSETQEGTNKAPTRKPKVEDEKDGSEVIEDEAVESESEGETLRIDLPDNPRQEESQANNEVEEGDNIIPQPTGDNQETDRSGEEGPADVLNIPEPEIRDENRLTAEDNIVPAERTHQSSVENAENIENLRTENEQLEENNPNSRREIDRDKKFRDLKKGKLIKYKRYDNDNWESGILHSRSGKVKGKYGNEWNIENSDGSIKWIDFKRMVEDIRTDGDSEDEVYEETQETQEEIFVSQTFFNQWNKQVEEAKERELSSWVEKEVYEEKINEGQKLMGLKWVIKPKIIEGSPGCKARLVCKGCEETETFRKDSPTCSKPAIRLSLVLIAASLWTLESLDVKCAFLQSDHITREIFVKPPKEAKTDKIWLLKKTPYGLKDAGRIWFLKVRDSLYKLGCKSLSTEPSLFFWQNGMELCGLVLVYVDDMMYGGKRIFHENIMEPLQKMIMIGAKHDQAFCYIGVNVVQHTDKSISLDQNHYLTNLKMIDEIQSSKKDYDPSKPVEDGIRDKMRKTIGKLNWLTTMSRPDLAFQTCFLSTMVNSATERDIVKLNKLVKYAVSSPLKLVFPPMSLDNLQLHVYTDAAFGNLRDGGSQGGYVILATDEKRSAIVDWSSHRLSRVAGNTLTAETLALMDGIDAAITYRYMLSEMLGLKMPKIVGFTDCKSLYDNTCTSHIAQEKRLRIELAALREHVDKDELAIRWISTKSQLADSLTKEGVSTQLLRRVVQEGLVEW